MDDPSRTIATCVDEFEPSLWHIVGQDRARIALMALVDQYHNDQMMGRNPKFPTILLLGDYGSGRRALARAIHHAVGNLYFKQPGNVLGMSEEPGDFFDNANEHTTYYISNIGSLNTTIIGHLNYVIRDHICYKSFPNPTNEPISVGNRLVILSAGPADKLNQDLLRHMTHLVELGMYDETSIFNILRQRVNGLNWQATDAALQLITQNAERVPGRAMKMLHFSHSFARANHKDSIDITYVKRAIELGF